MKRALAAATAAAAALLLMPLARAERADSLKKLDIKCDNIDVDSVPRTTIVTGNVIATRGTLLLKAERAEVKEAPDGYQTMVLTAAPGRSVFFRQKRDAGPDEWIEGQAERVEYDERTEVVRMFSHAALRQMEGRELVREMSSAFISYDNRKDALLGRNDPSGADVPGKARGSITYQPRRTASAAQPEAGKQ
jgi:lipopolysaccharide export system protein LptA